MSNSYRALNRASRITGAVAMLALAACQSPDVEPEGPVTTAATTSAARVSPVATSSRPSAIVQYSTIQHPVIANAGMVVSQNQLASQVGRDILAAGGNAIDAAVATGFALAVTLPRAGNLGGSGFMLVHLADARQTIALDFRSAGPAAFDPEAYRTEGRISTRELRFGAHASGVPGTVAGLYEAWQQHGSLPWAQLVAPAAKLARDGIVVTEDLAFALGEAQRVMQRFPASLSAYFKRQADGSHVRYQAGELLVQPDLAWSLDAIATDGADAFYRGAIAQRILAAMSQDAGLLSADDLASYRVRTRAPIQTSYRDHQVITMPPVSGGGMALLQMLNVLSNFDVAATPQGSARSIHLLAEVMKRAAANRRQGLGDPDFVDVPVAGYLSAQIAASIADQIDLTAATPVADIQPMDARKFESRDTTHFSVMDRHGNAVATTYTLGYSFGSYYVVPGTGILLDNQLRNYSYNQPGHANAFAPGKRMLSTMTPTIVLNEDGAVRIVTGTPGGSRIINVILQLLVNVIDYDMNIAEATHTPRIYQGWRSAELTVEPGFPALDTRDLLRKWGHQIKPAATMGSTQSIMAQGGLYFGAADPRRPGAGAAGLNNPPLPD